VINLERTAARAAHRAHRVAVVLLLILWAAWRIVDEVTRGEGKVIPSRQLQVVQSLDGGVVSEILVREGQVVDAGQMLLRIDETRATSGVRESAAQAFALRARQARLRALAEGVAFLPPAARAGDVEEQRIIDEERNLYETRLSELNTNISISRQQLQQREQELTEARPARRSAERSARSGPAGADQDPPAAAPGAVSEVDILRLEREVSRAASGDVEQATAQIARVQAAIGEAQRKIQETELTFRNEARKELAEVLGKLNALNEGAVALADKVDKSQVKIPGARPGAAAAGQYRRRGGAARQGHRRDRAAGRCAGAGGPGPAQGHRLHPPGPDGHGQVHAPTTSRSTAACPPRWRTSARTPWSTSAAMPSTSCRVRTDEANFDDKLPIIPGMTAEVDILTGKKTVMSYLLKPVLKAKAYALRER
jgi:adhesin transport system membrane fusion protein